MTLSKELIESDSSVVYANLCKVSGSRSSQVFVVVLNAEFNSVETNQLIDGTPIVWIHPIKRTINNCYTFAVPPAELVAVILEVKSYLLFLHWNIISIFPHHSNGSDWRIGIAIFGKGFIPIGEAEIPKLINKFKTKIVSSCMSFLMIRNDKNPLENLSPICPGCAISPFPFSNLSAHASIGTLGGFLIQNGRRFMVTCGHLFETVHMESNNPTEKLLPVGTEVTQACSLAAYFYERSLVGINPFKEHDLLLLSRGTTENRFKTILDQVQKLDGSCPVEIDTKGYDIEKSRHVTIGKLCDVSFDKVTSDNESTIDTAIVEIDQNIKHKSNVLTFGVLNANLHPYKDTALQIFLEGKENKLCWTKDDLSLALLKGQNIKCYTYGIRNKGHDGLVCSDALLSEFKYWGGSSNKEYFYFRDVIKTTLQSELGDSGAWVWSYSEGVIKMLGMISFAYYETCTTYTILIPIWTILNYATSTI